MPRRHFDETGYPCESAPVECSDGDAWFYTQKDGILVCANGCPQCGRQRKSLTLLWPAIKRALTDHERAKGRRAAMVSNGQTIDHIINRLEIRRVSVAGLTCTWCPCCLRVGVKDPAVKKSFELIWPGEEDCRQPIKTGPISECIGDLKEVKADIGSMT